MVTCRKGNRLLRVGIETSLARAREALARVDVARASLNLAGRIAGLVFAVLALVRVAAAAARAGYPLLGAAAVGRQRLGRARRALEALTCLRVARAGLVRVARAYFVLTVCALPCFDAIAA